MEAAVGGQDDFRVRRNPATIRKWLLEQLRKDVTFTRANTCMYILQPTGAVSSLKICAESLMKPSEKRFSVFIDRAGTLIEQGGPMLLLCAQPKDLLAAVDNRINPHRSSKTKNVELLKRRTP
jgi:hypothetical protein